MARALRPAADSSVLQTSPDLKFTTRQTDYQIKLVQGQVIYSVRRGSERLVLPIQWAFGVGNTGQTYVYLNDGILYEARVSFYRSLNGLEITNGHKDLPDSTLLQAAGRPISEDEVTRCFGCHVTTTEPDFEPGVHCTACHAGADEHAKSLDIGGKPLAPAHLGALKSLEMADFCGRCHRTYESVERSGVRGIENVRFQPYRLVKSRCFNPEDQRISCVACHNPHEEVRRDANYYDAKCKVCHSATPTSHRTIAQIKVCPVGKQSCTSCHMPKVELPEMHNSFTDHQIRVVRKGDGYSG